ncbi:hypothetical protein [Caulobacter sp. 17J80-11]|uniref:hypothetical protein n=1 Tax=Caulobacter sp. 17J80-11 TaxID=2763502 RepID=UPI0016538819|nr:hypothetical protein [Caulobacter sp. 17J80-11]MBC6982943.1 hypothetical protein [Caulobacter sp. 17J80-11]
MAGIGVAVAAGLALAWMNLAVGIVGNEENPLNRTYFGVLAVAAAGAVLARLRPRGLVLALVATALAQVAAAVIVQLAGHFTWVLTGGFVGLWLLSAWLFRTAARAET